MSLASASRRGEAGLEPAEARESATELEIVKPPADFAVGEKR